MKQLQKIATSLLIVALLFSTLVTPFSNKVNANTGGPTSLAPTGIGTEGDPYLISSIDNLVWLQEQSQTDSFSGKYFRQTADIDLTSITNWGGIGKASTSAFKGNYDGYGHSIKNMKMNSSGSVLGFFNAAQDATIKNVSLENASIIVSIVSGIDTNALNAGLLVGSMSSSGLSAPTNVIKNVYTSGEIYAVNEYTDTSATAVGGIVGFARKLNIENSYSIASITVNNAYTGGLVGYSYNSSSYPSAITNSFFAGEILGFATRTGKLSGYSAKEITMTNATAVGSSEDLAAYYVAYTQNSIALGENAKTVDFYKDKNNLSTWDFVNTWGIDSNKNSGFPILTPQASNSTTYTVTFDTVGGSTIAAQTVTADTVAVVPNPPTKSGFTFVGWYTDTTYTTVFDFTESIIANKTLYAKWSGNKNNVLFDDLDDTTTDIPFEVEQGQSVPSDKIKTPEQMQVQADKVFLGWSMSTADSAQVVDLSIIKITAPTTFYAKWKTLEDNDTSVTLDEANDKGYTLSKAPSGKFWTIDSWVGQTATELIIPSYVNNLPVTVTKAGTSSKPTFRTAIDSHNKASSALTKLVIPSTLQMIGHYTFANNQLTSVVLPKGVISIGDAAFEGNELTIVTLPESLTTMGGNAFYNNKLETVIFNGNGVEDLPSSAFRMNGKNKNSFATIDSTKIKPNGITKFTLWDKAGFSVWIVMHTITFDVNGGTLTEVTTKETADLSFFTAPTDPTRTNYIFNGWYGDITDETTKYATTSPVTADITVKAKWTKIPTGMITVKYLDESTNVEITTAKVDNDVALGTHTYTALTLPNYTLVSTGTVTTTLTTDDTTELIIFKYRKVQDNNNSGDGNTTSPPPTNASNVIVIVNGKEESIGQATTTIVGNQAQLTLTVDETKLQEKLAAEGDKATVIIPVTNSDADVIVGQLNGQMVKNMEDKQATVVVQTPTASYTLPANEININAIFQQIGSNVDLKDIKINIEIAKPADETVKFVEDTAQKGNFTLQVPPVEFKVTYTSGDKSGEVSRFNAYVERTIAIPDGVDPNKITTGIVVDPVDGTTYHVPTKIIQKDGKYYAVINSLTNSLYAVVWHPLQFADVANHWAKDAINNLGSRMVVNGVSAGTFAPNQDITRAQFAAIIVRGLGLKPGVGSNNFGDVAKDAWYADYISTATEYSLITGYTNGNFGPNDKITRQQAFAIIARAMALTDLNADLSSSEVTKILSTFKDTNKIATYAKPYVALAVQKGIVNGRSNQTIAPGDNITRAEVAVIIERLLQKSNLINE